MSVSVNEPDAREPIIYLGTYILFGIFFPFAMDVDAWQGGGGDSHWLQVPIYFP
jgi:hypothetical protein